MGNRMGSAGSIAAISMVLLATFSVVAWAAPVLLAGIAAGSQSLAGMMAEEAKAAVQEYVDGLAIQSVALSVDGQGVTTTAGGLGFYWINTDVIDEAVNQYAGGNLTKQYMIEKDLAVTPVEAELETEVDSVKVKSFADTQCQGTTAESQNVSITRENGQFVITDSAPGRVVDVAGIEAAPSEALKGGLGQPMEVTVQVTEGQLVITSEVLATIQDVLGTYTTDLSSGGVARSTDLAVDAAKINGHALMPGGVPSGYECLQPFTIANGHKTAAVYKNDQVMDSIGGDVCQLVTTLYDASLEAEVEIVQRQNHSMIVTYVKPSGDAAIAGTYKDIRIENNYNTPIYVEGYTSGRRLTFTICGKETRPANRKVEYVSETLGSIGPGEPQLIVDNTLAPEARVKIQSSHIGLRFRLWRVVAVDGVEQERTLLNKDTYNASKAIYRVGPDLPVVLPVVPDATMLVDTALAETAPVTGVGGGPGVMQPAPEPAPAPEANPAPAANPAPEANPAPVANLAPVQGSPMATPVEGSQYVRQDGDRAGLRSVTALWDQVRIW